MRVTELERRRTHQCAPPLPLPQRGGTWRNISERGGAGTCLSEIFFYARLTGVYSAQKRMVPSSTERQLRAGCDFLDVIEQVVHRDRIFVHMPNEVEQSIGDSKSFRSLSKRARRMGGTDVETSDASVVVEPGREFFEMKGLHVTIGIPDRAQRVKLVLLVILLVTFLLVVLKWRSCTVRSRAPSACFNGP